MIVAVAIAEKEERKRIHTIQNTILGYDVLKWVKADAIVRDENHLEADYREVEVMTPTKGNHRFAQCQKLYEDVHSFLKERKWAPAQTESEAGGTTWIELSIVFDIGGSRSQEGQHQKSRAATRRAEKRKGNIKDTEGKKGVTTEPLQSRNPPSTKNSKPSRP